MENSQTTLEQPESLRDTLLNAVETVEVASENTETPSERTESFSDERTTDRARDDKGKFVKSQPEAIAEGDFNQETEVQVKPRPSSWKKDYEEDWGRLDPRIQDYIQQREADYAKGVSTYKNQWDSAAPIMETIRQFQPMLEHNNIAPSAWINALGNAHAKLTYGSPEEKVNMFYKLANDYGINLGAVTGESDYDPQFSQLANELAQIKNQWGMFQAQQEAAEQSMLVNEIDEFKVDKPYFEEVRESMAGLLQSGMANDLQDAYDKAIRLNDDVFQRVQAEHAGKNGAAQREKVATARAKVLSPKSTTPTASTTSGSKSASSAREAILAAFDTHSSGLI